jgi:hypothetical protein
MYYREWAFVNGPTHKAFLTLASRYASKVDAHYTSSGTVHLHATFSNKDKAYAFVYAMYRHTGREDVSLRRVV